jgi:hypothetical protein
MTCTSPQILVSIPILKLMGQFRFTVLFSNAMTALVGFDLRVLVAFWQRVSVVEAVPPAPFKNPISGHLVAGNQFGASRQFTGNLLFKTPQSTFIGSPIRGHIGNPVLFG